jgi:hypothetical protein
MALARRPTPDLHSVGPGIRGRQLRSGPTVDALASTDHAPTKENDLMATKANGHAWTEHLKIDGDRMLGEIKRLIAEGNVRRITIKQGEHTVAEFPLTIGVVGAVLAPWLAAVGAIAALVSDSSIVVERVGAPESAKRAGPVEAAVAPTARPTDEHQA